MNAVKIYLSLELLISGKETAPIGLQVLLLSIVLLSPCVDVENVPNLVDFVLLLIGVVRGRVIGEGVHLWGKVGLRLLLLGLCGLGICLSLPLVAQLIVDVGIQPSDLVIVDQNGNFAFPVSQFLALLLHLLSCTQGLPQSFILHQHIRPLRGKLIALDFQIPDISKAGEKGRKILFIGELGIIADGCVEYGYEVLLDLI